jgi:MFS family permease
MSRPASLLQLPPLVQTLLTGALLSRLAFSITTPFLTIYLIRNTHLSIAAVGLVVGGASVAGMVGGFIAGALTDRLGRNVILLSTLYCWVLVFLFFSTAHSPSVLVLLTLLNGACRAIFDPVSQVLMSDMTPLDQRYRVFSMRYTAANIGYSVGPLIGSWLGLTGGNGAFVFSCAIFLAYALLLHIMMVRTRSETESRSQLKQQASLASVVKVIVTDRALLFYILGGMIVRCAYEQINTNVSVHLQEHVVRGLALFAVIISLNAVIVVICQVPISKWAEKKVSLEQRVRGEYLLCIGTGRSGVHEELDGRHHRHGHLYHRRNPVLSCRNLVH